MAAFGRPNPFHIALGFQYLNVFVRCGPTAVQSCGNSEPIMSYPSFICSFSNEKADKYLILDGKFKSLGRHLKISHVFALFCSQYI